MSISNGSRPPPRDNRVMLPALEFLWIPLLACLVLAGIHVYLGLHVLARGIIFVDLALAQVAALGLTVAAIAVLVVDRAPQGAEYIKQLLVGSILTVTLREVGELALLYGAVGALHWIFRRPLLEISFRPDAAVEKERRVGWWDFLFYASFGLVVTSSVRIAGVLLVFSYLIVPATVAALLTNS